MSRILARLRNIKSEDIKHILKKDAASIEDDGLHVRYLWQNKDNSAEVLFLSDADLKKRKRSIGGNS
jgi:D-hexose-6-phosphate mutarotase